MLFGAYLLCVDLNEVLASELPKHSEEVVILYACSYYPNPLTPQN